MLSDEDVERIINEIDIEKIYSFNKSTRGNKIILTYENSSISVILQYKNITDCQKVLKAISEKI